MTKLDEDTIKGQWKKQNDAHKAQWNAIVHIGEVLGLQFDKNGDVVGRTEKPQAVASNVEQTSTTIDTKALAKDLLAELADAQDKDGLFVLDMEAVLKANGDFHHHMVEDWNHWYVAQAQAYLRLMGMEDVYVDGKFFIKEIEGSPFSKARRLLESIAANQEQLLSTKEQKPPSQQNEIVVPKTENPQTEHSDKSRFRRAILSFKLPRINSILLFITLLTVSFMIFIGNENYMLRDVARRYEIYHTFYGAMPEDSMFIQMVDSQIDSIGSKRVLEHVQMQVQRMKQGKK